MLRQAVYVIFFENVTSQRSPVFIGVRRGWGIYPPNFFEI